MIQHFVHLAEAAGVETADRILANARASFEELAEQPRLGAPLRLRKPALDNMRKWRVSGFENYLVFYLPRADGVSIVRVLHAARDWWSLRGIKDD